MANLRAGLAVAGLAARPSGASPHAPAARTFLEHVEELRRRLMVTGLALVGVTLAALTLRFEARPWGFVPVLDPFDNVAADLLRRLVADQAPAGVQVVVMRPAEAFTAQVAVAVSLAVALTLPLALVQAGLFLRPALKGRERRILGLLLAPALALFAAGALFAYTWAVPPALRALYQYAAAVDATPLLPVGELVSFTVGLCLVTGAAFLLPLAMYAVARVGLAGARSFARFWRHAVIAIVVVAGIVTPDPTIVSQLVVAAPLVALYVLGIGLAGLGARSHARSLRA